MSKNLNQIKLDPRPNAKVYAVAIIANILGKSHYEILTNKDLKISDFINSEHGNDGGYIPFKAWKDLQLAVPNVDLDSL